MSGVTFLRFAGEFVEQIVYHLLAVAEIGAFELAERVSEIDQAALRRKPKYAEGSRNLESPCESGGGSFALVVRIRSACIDKASVIAARSPAPSSWRVASSINSTGSTSSHDGRSPIQSLSTVGAAGWHSSL